MKTQTNSRTRTVFLVFILLVAAFLRFWKLGSIPNGLTPDEAALGYNAYSILKTGKDEYGQRLPLVFKSFGDYKPGLYIYLSTVPVFLLGLSDFSVRVVSALAGVIAVFLLYEIVGEFLNKKDIVRLGSLFQMLCAASIALSPWHIHFSRGAWEANLSLTLTLAAILFFLRSLKTFGYFFYFLLSLILTVLTYHGAKLSSVIVFVTLVLVFFSDFISILRKNIFRLLVYLVFSFVILLPVFLNLFEEGWGRLAVFSVFSYPRPPELLSLFLGEGNESKMSLTYLLFHSEGLNFLRGILGRWFNHLSFQFLFFAGDWSNPRHVPPNHGVLPLFDLITLPLGFFLAVKDLRSKLIRFFVTWLILAPLPAALSRDSVSAVRAFNMTASFAVISSLGASYFINFVLGIKKVFPRILVSSLAVVLFLGSFLYFLDAYFIHVPVHNAKYWEYGLREAVKAVLPIKDSYRKVIFQQSYAQPYIYFLFYGKYDPASYQQKASLTRYLGPDVGLVDRLDNIEFTYLSWPIVVEENVLVVGTSDVIVSYSENDYRLIKNIIDPDGNVSYRILESRRR